MKMKKIEELQTAKKLTANEGMVMEWLLSEGWYEVEFSDVEAQDIADAVGKTTRVIRGTISSLIKKGYIEVQGANGNDDTFIYATEEGYKLDDEYEEKWEG